MAFRFDPRIRPRSLRGQLIWLVATLAVPLIVLQVWWGYRESQRLEEAAGAEALALADATAMTVRQFLTQAELSMTATSREFGETFVSGTPCDDAMRNLVTISPYLVGVTTVDRDGNVMCASLAVERSTSEWGWFPDLQEDPRFFVGNPVLGVVSGAWFLPLVAPVLDTEGRFAGAIVGGV